MFTKKLAMLGTSACLLFGASRGFNAQAATKTGRVYTSVRQEWELNQLLTLPNPLLANFCILTDEKSQNVSEALKNVVESGKAALPVSAVDVEVDEPDTRDLVQRYIVSKIPTIVALHGGEPVQSLEPQAMGREELEHEILKWVEKLKKD